MRNRPALSRQTPSKARRSTDAARDARLASIPRNPFGELFRKDPFPTRLPVSHSYSCTGVLTSGAINTCGSAVVHYLNDMYSPGGSNPHQPYGFDQYSALYRFFKVKRFSFEIDIGPNGDGTNVMFIGIFSPSAGINLTGANIDRAAELPNVARTMVPVAQPVRIAKSFGMHELLNISKKEFDADVSLYNGTAAASPAYRPTMQLVSACATAAKPTSFTIKCTFEAEWYDRVAQAGS